MPPYPPFYGGDAIYSSHLIEALAKAGASVAVLCQAPDRREVPGIPETAGVTWRIVCARQRRQAASLFSTLPSLAYRFGGVKIRAALEEELGAKDWDAILIDHIGTGWAIAPILRHYRNRTPPVLAYVSHNHEETTRYDVYRDFHGALFMKFGLFLDAIKTTRLERRVTECVNLITVNTEEDRALFQTHKLAAHLLTLPPGYDGPVRERSPDFAEIPRRVVVLGSFNWVAKRMNLEAFLAIASPRFEAAGAEIVVVGDMPDGYGKAIEARFGAVRAVGRVEDVYSFLRESRVGIIPEQSGGGFKHKALSYIFQRLPIACLEGSVAGLPMRAGEGILVFPDMKRLVEGVLESLDDAHLLNRLQGRAFSQCREGFSWAERGEWLLAGLRKG
ncbi:MAG: hypothetical protein COA65_06865 [Rhodospirillaceae bacterium]|nr:MAG: hypothetical protein COA65_06865 [Rhodospirillaceae bacterium]